MADSNIDRLVSGYYELEEKKRFVYDSLEKYARDKFTTIEFVKAYDPKFGVIFFAKVATPDGYIPLNIDKVNKVNEPVTVIYRPCDEKGSDVKVVINLTGIEKFVLSKEACAIIGTTANREVSYLNSINIKVVFGKDKKISYQFRFPITKEEIESSIMQKKIK